MNIHLKNAQRIADLLDNKFKILGIRFGLDPILGVIPGLGDAIAIILSMYLLYIGAQMKIPAKDLRRMILNIGIDYLIGVVPIIGDAFDIVFKANEKNFRILKKYES